MDIEDLFSIEWKSSVCEISEQDFCEMFDTETERSLTRDIWLREHRGESEIAIYHPYIERDVFAWNLSVF